MHDKLAFEYRFNLETFDKMKKSPIVYGQAIQLLHITTNKFFSFSLQEADSEKEYFKVYLSDYSCDETMFKFLPAFRY